MCQKRDNFKLKIAYTKPSITQLEIDYAADAAANGWGEKCYDYIVRFEREFASYIGVEYAIATSSCTGAVTLGLSALGIGAGDEVILADTNWIATASPIVHAGAKPVLVDILPDTWCIDPHKAENAITDRTKAIIATHLYGNLCDMDALTKLCQRYGLHLIEDSAEAIGSVYKGRRAGSMGTFSTFSFHGTKTITTGEGGMFLTGDADLFETVLTLSNHGRSRKQTKQFWADLAGFKFKMSNIQAAMGCAQLKRVDELVSKKRAILARYQENLLPCEDITMNHEHAYETIGAWMPTAVFSEKCGITRDRILEEFKKEDIDARVFFWPVSSLPMFDKKHNEIAYSISDRAINLPSYHEISNDEIDTVCKVIERLLK